MGWLIQSSGWQVWRVFMAGGAFLVTALLLPLWRLPSNEQRARALAKWVTGCQSFKEPDWGNSCSNCASEVAWNIYIQKCPKWWGFDKSKTASSREQSAFLATGPPEHRAEKRATPRSTVLLRTFGGRRIERWPASPRLWLLRRWGLPKIVFIQDQNHPTFFVFSQVFSNFEPLRMCKGFGKVFLDRFWKIILWPSELVHWNHPVFKWGNTSESLIKDIVRLFLLYLFLFASQDRDIFGTPWTCCRSGCVSTSICKVSQWTMLQFLAQTFGGSNEPEHFCHTQLKWSDSSFPWIPN